MQNHQTSTPPSVRNPILAALADERRRRTLAVLLERAGPVSERELATAVAADEAGKPVDDVTDEERRTVAVAVRHRHLPKLDEAELVAWDRDGGSVTTTDVPALADADLRQLVHLEVEGLDDLLACLADTRRGVALSVLADHTGRMDRHALARAVCEWDGIDQDVDAVDTVERQLHHVDLPKLDEAGVVSYDRETGSVSYQGHPAIDDSRLAVDAGRVSQAIVAAAH